MKELFTVAKKLLLIHIIHLRSLAAVRLQNGRCRNLTDGGKQRAEAVQHVLHLSNNSLTQSVTKVGIVMKVQAKQRRHTVIFCLGHRFTAVDLGLTCSGGIVFFLMCKWVKQIPAVASREKQATPSPEWFKPGSSDTLSYCWCQFYGIFQGNIEQPQTCFCERYCLVLCATEVRGNHLERSCLPLCKLKLEAFSVMAAQAWKGPSSTPCIEAPIPSKCLLKAVLFLLSSKVLF